MLESVFSAGIVGVIMLLAQFFIMPKLERKKTILQAQWMAKRDTFISAVKLVDRHFESTEWTGPAVPEDYKPSKQRPKQSEINDLVSQLTLVTDDP